MIEHLDRWLASSIAKHFSSNLPNDFVFYIQGQIRQVVENSTRTEIELRLDEIIIEQCASNVIEVSLFAIVSIESIINQLDIWKHKRDIGTMRQLFTSIPIYKYGDDSSYVGCLQLQNQVQENSEQPISGQRSFYTTLIGKFTMVI